MSSSLLALFARSTHAPAQVRYSRSLDITLLSPISHCIAINREPRLRSAETQILSKSSIKVRLTLKSLSSCSAFTCIKSVVASVAELRSGSSALHLSQRAWRIARLLWCKVIRSRAAICHCAISVTAPHETKGGTDKSFLNGLNSHCENARPRSGLVGP